ncbi:hypothetical protein Nepgr_023017 [Nepenthes gracilis]|uniref:Uncharacterized protein n=1 Tax=Nepenthes gracilis TaxID=150966 RepID=A0AAD3T1P1_NEPGR|nr:hypothetical protein Nepgr_023017 [Nepenthes gracilis]
MVLLVSVLEHSDVVPCRATGWIILQPNSSKSGPHALGSSIQSSPPDHLSAELESCKFWLYFLSRGSVSGPVVVGMSKFRLMTLVSLWTSTAVPLLGSTWVSGFIAEPDTVLPWSMHWICWRLRNLLCCIGLVASDGCSSFEQLSPVAFSGKAGINGCRPVGVEFRQALELGGDSLAAVLNCWC